MREPPGPCGAGRLRCAYAFVAECLCRWAAARPRDRHTRACGSEWSISKPGQALPPPTGTAAWPSSSPCNTTPIPATMSSLDHSRINKPSTTCAHAQWCNACPWRRCAYPRLGLLVWALHPIRRHYTPSVRVHRHVRGAAPRNGCSATTAHRHRGQAPQAPRRLPSGVAWCAGMVHCSVMSHAIPLRRCAVLYQSAVLRHSCL